MKGGTVGILTMTEGSFFNWQEIGLKHGLKYPDDYKVMQTAGAGARHHLLIEGKIDVGLQSIPWAFVAEDFGLQQSRRRRRLCAGMAVHGLQRQRRLGGGQCRQGRGFSARDAARHRLDLPASRRGRRDRRARAQHQAGLRATRLGLYTRTGTLTRDLAFTEAGLRKVFETQKKAGLLSADLPFDMSKYVAGGYLERAKATVKFD